ncbi:lycopene cyclase [Sphingobacteriaceae bacterium]|nr:lycopene cyclase [Sphingobacteriaceae bacterium]
MSPLKKEVSGTYDYIIAGMGCAGLSLAMQLSLSEVKFEKVLLIDKDLKTKNDRTWCFWTTQQKHWFDDIIFRKWKKFSFKSKDFDETFDLGNYSYMMIKGIDFYEYCLSRLRADSRFEIVIDVIDSIASGQNEAFLETKTKSFSANYVFNSSFRNLHIKPTHINYLQHFKGWLIETEEACFNTDVPVFMDFDIEQNQDCRFVYILPFSKTKALIEYTGFSKDELHDAEYDFELKHYIKNKLNQTSYTILETEKGKIPMYESEFINVYGEKVISIGTAGGSSKSSTGYTFHFIQRNIQELITQMEKDPLHVKPSKRKKRYALYDKIFLDVINEKQIETRLVFKNLFQKNKINDLLAFLNEESLFKQDLRIMNSVSKKEFVNSAFRKLWI